jgi:hypothetical protein
MWTIFISFLGKVKWTPLKISVGVNIILIILLLFLYSSDEIVERVVIKDHYIEVPGKIGRIESKELPSPISEMRDSTRYRDLLNKYRELKSSKEQEELYKEAIEEREYRETFEDETQEIEVYTKVQQGKILEQAINYKIDPYILKVRDTVKIESRGLKKNKLLGGVELGIPIDLQSDQSNIVIKSSLYFQNKKDNIISLGIDSRKTIWAGYIVRF